MKKYLVTLGNDNSIEIEVEKLTETDIYNKVESKFGLFGNYSMCLQYIKSMDIHTLTLTKRGSQAILLIKEVVKDNNKSSFDIDKFNAEIDKLIKGEVFSIYLKNVSVDELEAVLVKGDFTNFDSDSDGDIKIYYFAHKDWEVNDNGEYCNRLNVNFDLRDLSVEINLEDGASKIKDFEDTKRKIDEKKLEIDKINDRIEELESTISSLQIEKEDLDNEIDSLENDLTYDTYC